MNTNQKTETYTVYHGGRLLGMGTWENNLSSLEAAQKSANECQRTVGGLPKICRSSDGAYYIDDGWFDLVDGEWVEK